MSRLIALLMLAWLLGLAVLPAAAACRTHTYMMNGQMVTCMTCCFGSTCNTTCF